MRRTYRIRFVLYREDAKHNSNEHNGRNEIIYRYVWDPEEPLDGAVITALHALADGNPAYEVEGAAFERERPE